MSHLITRIVGAALLAGSVITSAGTAQDTKEIVVYNAQHESLAEAWATAFTADTGIKVTFRHGDDMEMANQLVQEGSASPADVFLTENSPAMALVERAGGFAPVDPDTLAQVPETFRPASGNWVGIAARSTVFAYDKTKLQEADLPKSLLDLSDPAWKGRWAAAPSGADFQAIIGALVALKGQDVAATWLKAMKENAVAYKSNSTAMKAVNAGEIPGAVIFHYYWFGDQAKTGENSANVALHYFKNQDPGAFVSISGGGVLVSSKHPSEAQAFLKWVTGKAGQAILRDGTSFEYAVGAGDASNPALVPLSDLQAPKLNPSILDNKTVTDLMTVAGIL